MNEFNNTKKQLSDYLLHTYTKQMSLTLRNQNRKGLLLSDLSDIRVIKPFAADQ